MVFTRSSLLRAEPKKSAAIGPGKEGPCHVGSNANKNVKVKRFATISPESSTMDDDFETPPASRTTRGKRTNVLSSSGQTRVGQTRKLGTMMRCYSGSKISKYCGDSKSSSISSYEGVSSRPIPDFSAFAYEPGSLVESSVSDGSTQNDGALTNSHSVIEQIEDQTETSPVSHGTPALKATSKSNGNCTGSSRKRQRIDPGSLNPPKDWEKVYSLVEELRADRTAPVDSNGAEALPQRNLGDKVYRFQVLIALMLSSQTKDGIVGEVMRALQQVSNVRKARMWDVTRSLLLDAFQLRSKMSCRVCYFKV